MINSRPVGYVFGLVALFLAASMLMPAVADMVQGDPNYVSFVESALLTGLFGGLIALSCASSVGNSLSARQAFLLTASIWIGIPLFASLPFMIGQPHISFTDAYFEAVSGITTTGSSVIPGMDDMPTSIVLWRGYLNWIGGLGIAFVAMMFLPIMRVGGMQFFRTEGFDTMGKVLPRATDISRALVRFYVGITIACGFTYYLFGMTGLDAIVHAFATVATGGFSTSDSSFGKYSGYIEYAGSFFMIVASLPYIRFVQMLIGTPQSLLRDQQVRAYLLWLGVAVALVVWYRTANEDLPLEFVLRQSLFNLTSIISGTGFGTAGVAEWGAFPLVVAFCIGMIGGCTSSSSASLSVFRWLVAMSAVRVAIARIYSPHRIIHPKFDDSVIDDDVLRQVMFYFTGYILTLGVLSIAISMTEGVDTVSAVFAIWTSLGNIGYGIGETTAPTGTMLGFTVIAKWIMILAMLMGRLGLLAIFLLFLPRFWRG